MLQDPRIDKLAGVLVEYALGVQPGWQVCINSTVLAAPLVYAVYRRVLAAGAFPATQIALPETEELLLTDGNESQLQHIPPFAPLVWTQFDAVLNIRAETNTRANSAVPPERMALYRKAWAPINKGFIDWVAQGRSTCLTQFPTMAYAQDARMSLDGYQEFLFHAGLIDSADPVAAWRAMSAQQQRVVDWLKGKRQVHVEGPNADLTLGIAGRTFINADGHYNFPDGEVFTSPVEDSVNGHIHYTYPATYGGRDVEDVELWFEAGRVARFTAGRGADYLARMLDLDAGARRLGEFAIGTNPGVTQFTGNVLFDEKMAGTIHCALGQSFPMIGGRNESALHWDMVADMREGRITVDGETLYENGNFRI